MAFVLPRAASSFQRSSNTWAGRVAVGIALIVLVNVLPTGAGVPVALTTAAHPGAVVSHSDLNRAMASLSAGSGPARGQSLTCSGTSSLECTPTVAAAPHPGASPPPRWTDLTPKITSSVPPYRYLGVMVYDPVDHYVVLFGGFGNGSSTPYGDTWSYANGAWTELSPSSSPSGRYVAMATWDAADGYLLLFGGYDSSTATVNNETWSFVGGQWTQHTISVAPTPRWRAVMAFDAKDNYAVLFGGSDPTGTTIDRDTWTYSAGVWTQLTGLAPLPAGRIRSEMTYDAADGYLVMFGGCSSQACTSALQDTWTFVAGNWTLASPTTKPSARAYQGLTYDAAQGYVLMFGGDAYATVTGTHDTWKFLSGNWTDLSASYTTYPGTRAFEMMAYDGADGYTVLFGGQNPAATTVFFDDTWAYGPSVIGAFSVAPGTIDVGQSTALNATPLSFTGTANFSYSGLPPGCTSADIPVLTCTPSQPGLFLVSASVNDSNGFPVTKNVTLTVNPDPTIDAVALDHAVVTSGTRIHLNVTASNGTVPFSYAYSGLPSGCASANTATYSCVPTGTGPFTIAISVRDSTGWSVGSSAGLTVNTQPMLASFVVLPHVIDLGESVTLYANASGGTAPLTYTYNGLTNGCVSADVSVLVCTPTAVGIYDVGVNATDAFGWKAAGGASFTVDPRPQILQFNLEPRAIDLGAAFTLWFNTTGGTGSLSLSYAGLPTGCSIGAAASGACTPIDSGTYNVTATVTDGRGIAIASTVTLTVVPDPSITAVTVNPTSIDVGQNLTITVTVIGGTAPFQYLYTNLPTGCASATTSNVSCKPRTANVYQITAQVTDAWKQTSSLGASFTVHPAPVIISFNTTFPAVTLGGSTTFITVAQYGSGTYSYVYTSLPTGCASSNSSSLGCVPTVTGTFNVTVTITDSLGLSASMTTLVTIQAASTSSTFLGLSGSTGYLLIAAVVVIAVLAIALVLVMRRRRKVAPAPEAWEETPGDGTPPT